MLQAAGVQDRGHLTAVAQPVQVAASSRAFAAVEATMFLPGAMEMKLVTAINEIQDQLKNVQQMQAAVWAFAAILAGSSGCLGPSRQMW